MKKYLILPILAAFAVSPALAQSTMSPEPNKQATGHEGKEDNVVKGAKDSTDSSGMSTGADRTGTPAPNKQATGNEGKEDNVVKGAEQSSEPGAMGSSKTDELPPNKQKTGNEGKDDNKLPK